jgi:tetratricopeptide (TPR) repeat protein/tRNA A-37 threonylcarbamoyl transferase component Bud32
MAALRDDSVAAAPGEATATDQGARPSKAEEGAALTRGVAVDRYLVLSPIGSGAAGTVYAAYDSGLDRKVALKLLRRPARDGSAIERLLDEAKAMARLAHPSVVAVHDVGTYQDHLFIAMELVEGQSLRTWLDERPERPWRELLPVVVQAGAGLQAAHEAGILHRDFKPDNILVGRDGRARVTDFGLAAPFDPAPPGQGGERQLGTGSSEAAESTHSLAGTPGYMAPELYRGEPASPAADQFSFCVVVAEALTGRRPFGGGSLAEVAERMKEAREPDLPPSPRLPRWLRRVLLRGLRPLPADRYPSMKALLAVLGRHPVATRRLAAVAVVPLLFAALAGWGLRWRREAAAHRCPSAAAALAGIWDAGRARVVHDAMLATGVAYAPEVWLSVSRSLDRYAGAWVTMQESACHATRVAGTQSEALLDRRMQCLTQRRHELDSLVALFARADRSVMPNAVQAASGLTPLDGCADSAALLATVPPPGDPKVRSQVDALSARLTEARTLSLAGKFGEARKLCDDLVAQARPLGYRPVEAQALLALARVQSKQGDAKGAEESLLGAAAAATSGRDDPTLAGAFGLLTLVVGATQARFDEGLRWGRLTDATLDRLDHADWYRAANEYSIGAILLTQDHPDQALSHLRVAIDLRERVDPDDSELLPNALQAAGSALGDLGRYPEAKAYMERALAIAERLLGPRHPNVQNALLSLANAEKDLRNFAVAEGLYRRGIDLIRTSLGPDHPYIGLTLGNLGSLFLEQDKPDEALPLLRQARDQLAKSLGPGHPYVGSADAEIADALRQQHHYDAALIEADRGLAILRAAQGPESLTASYTEVTRARILVDAGRAREALGPAERTLDRLSGQPAPPPERVAEAQLVVARALWDTGHDRTRALELARQAERSMAARGQAGEGQLEDVRGWLRVHHL